MANYKGRSVRRARPDWWYFDRLPQPLRLRLAGATQPWSSSWIWTKLNSTAKLYGKKRALEMMLEACDEWDRRQSLKGWYQPGVGQPYLPSPCAVMEVTPLVTRFT